MQSFIAKELQMENRDKKRTASGVHSRKGKRGYVGRMSLPYEMMSRKEKREYTKSSKVRVYSMYDNIKTYEEIKSLPIEEQKKHMIEYRKRFAGKEIAKGLGVAVGTYYQIAKKLGVTAPYKKSNKTKHTYKDTVKKEVTATTTPAVLERVEAVLKQDGLIFGYSGEKKADDIIKRLTKLQLLLEDEESLFDVEIRIREIQ